MKVRAVTLSLLMVLSMVGGVVALSGSAAAAPPGMVTTGSDISDQTVNPSNPPKGTLPEQAQGAPSQGNSGQNGPPEHALEKMPDHARQNVMASRASMQVQWAPTDDGKTALVVTDDQVSDAGEVAIPVGAFEETRGEVPTLARGVHESGERWNAEVTVSDGYAVFEIPHFSTNTVTWSGQFTLEAYPATDGFSYTYEQDDPVSSWNVNLTGVETTETETVSATGVSDGGTIDASIAGNVDPQETTLTLEGNQYTGSRYTPSGTGTVTGVGINGDADPTGPSGGEPEITFTGNGDTNARTVSSSGDSNGATTSYTVGGNLPAENEQVTFTGTSTDTGRASYSLGTYSDGGSDSFSISDLDEAANPSIGITGVRNTEAETVSQNAVYDGGTVSTAVAGTSLEGPSNGNPTVTFTGDSYSNGYDIVSLEGDGSTDTYDSFMTSTDPGAQEFTPSEDMTLDYAVISTETNYLTGALDVYINEGEVDSNFREGTMAINDWDMGKVGAFSTATINFDNSTQVTAGQTYEIEFVYDSYEDGSDSCYISYDGSPSTTKAYTWDGFQSHAYDIGIGENVESSDPSVDIDGDSTAEASYSGVLADGSTTTYELPGMSTSDDSATISTTSGRVDVQFDYTEVTETTDPTISLNGNSYSYSGSLSGGSTGTLSPSVSDLQGGTNNVDVSLPSLSADAPPMEVGIDSVEYDDLQYTEDPAVDVDSDGTNDISYSGELPTGQTYSDSVSLTPGDKTASTSLTIGDVDWSMDFTEVTGTEDPSVDVDGDGVSEASYSGALNSGATTTKQLSGLQAGTHDIETAVASGPDPDWAITYDEELYTDSPSVDIDGDGSDEAVHTGKLAPGETSSPTINPTLSDDTWAVNTLGGPVDVSAQIEERTVTEDVTLSVNGNTATHSGVLDPGTSTSLSVDPAWINDSGENVVDLQVAPSLSADAPAQSVDLYYTHEGEDTDMVAFEAEKWSERYNVSKTFAENQSDASLQIPFAGDVVSVRNLEYSVNGGAWSDVPDSDYAFENTTINSTFGAVNVGDNVAVRATGSKVNVENGEVSVTEPTDVGGELDSALDVVSTSGTLIIGMGDSTETAYSYQESWEDGTTEYSTIDQDGQHLVLPSATDTSTFRVTTIPVEVDPETGDAVVSVDDPSSTEPTFHVGGGPAGEGSKVSFTFTEAADGEDYILYSETNDVVRDSGTANSPITLTDDDSDETLAFLIDDGAASGGSVSGASSGAIYIPQGDDGGSLPFDALPILGGGFLLVIGLGGAYRFSKNYDRGSSGQDDSDGGGVSDSIKSAPKVIVASVGSVTGKFAGAIKYGGSAVTPTIKRVLSTRLGRYAVIGVIATGVMYTGVLSMSEGERMVSLVAGGLVGLYVLLRETGNFNAPVYALIAATTLVLSLNSMGSEFVTELVSSPSFTIVVIVAGLIAWQLVEGWRDRGKTEVTIKADSNE